MTILRKLLRRMFQKGGPETPPDNSKAPELSEPAPGPPPPPNTPRYPTQSPVVPDAIAQEEGGSAARERVVRSQKEKHERRRTRRAAKKSGKNGSTSEKPRGGDRPETRHRIPVIREDADFYDLFGLREPEESDPVAFERMMEEALSKTDMAAVAAEKAAGGRTERPRSLKALIRSYPPPQETLDLHGCTAMDAISKVESFVRTGRRKGLQTVLVIVGKGRHSEDAAVLPRVVRDQINKMKHRKLVLAWEWEKGSQSRSGAIIVYLA